ncbi:HHLA2 protein, partial [Polyodon spathula]|nr:HHLA2 protein [Polyodon spathula]
MVPSSVICTEVQDCILNCTFIYIIAGDWDEKTGLCVGLWCYKQCAVCCWKSNKASSPAQAALLLGVIEKPYEGRPLPSTIDLQTERAKRMDSAGEEASLNSPELPWKQLYLKRRTESRIQLRRRVCFTGPAAAAVTGVLAILIVAAGRVSASEFVTFESSVKCTEGQDSILSCTFNYTGGDWDEKSAVVWRSAETGWIIHSYYENMDQLAHQLPQYVSRTSLFDSELQRGNASLLLRRVREEDAGEYDCSVPTPRLHGTGLTEVVMVPAEQHHWWVLGMVLPPLLCVVVGL